MIADLIPLKLDRKAVADREPHERDVHHTMMLSPFAVPYGVAYRADSDGGVIAVKFEYPSTEAMKPPQFLDGLDSPHVLVEVGIFTQKVVVMTFSPGVQREGLSIVAARLRAMANQVATPSPGRRLSYMMVSTILDTWSDMFYSHPPKPEV